MMGASAGVQHGTGGAGLAYQILKAGIPLNIPCLFAALRHITATGSALSRWHESEFTSEDVDG